MKKIKLVPKNQEAEAHEERLRMLSEDNADAHSSIDRFRESRRSRTSCISHSTLKSFNTSFSNFTICIRKDTTFFQNQFLL